MPTPPPPQIKRATLDDVPSVAPLFDAYRQFYGQAPDAALAESFLAERLLRSESVVFFATNPATGDALGFVQLYPSFSSASAQRVWILNDLFVVPEARRSGVAKQLLGTAAAFGAETGAVRLTLNTAHTNLPAQALYESLGWRLETQFRAYTLPL